MAIHDKPYRGHQLNMTHPLARGLRACWAFNDFGLTLWDCVRRSGDPINGFSGANWVGGEYGAAATFNGSTHRVALGTDVRFNTHLISVIAIARHNNPIRNRGEHFFHRENANPGAIQFSKRNASGGDQYKWMFGVRIEGNEGTVEQANSDGVADTSWVHLAGTYDGATVKLYVDGILQTDTATAAGTTDIDSYAGTWLGSHSSEAAETHFDGDLAFLGVWDRGLLQADVTMHLANPWALVRRPFSPAIFGTLAAIASTVDYEVLSATLGRAILNSARPRATLNATLTREVLDAQQPGYN